MISPAARYQGCLLGLACGDALGGPVEFVSRDALDLQYPDGLRDFTGGGWLDLFPGEITDDTQMTLDVARSLAEYPEANMADLAGRFLTWRNSAPKDIGNTTRDALDRLAQGTPWHEAGQQTHLARGPFDSAGNGAIMRCAPVALRFVGDPERVRDVSIDVSRITHANPLCIWASVAVNQAMVALLNGAGIDAAIEFSRQGIPEADVIGAIEHATSASRNEIRSGGFVLDTLAAAFWSLRITDSLEEAIVTAVALGEDTDTTGAVAGALAGAHYGLDAIPARWQNRLQHRDRLSELALRLLHLSGQFT